MTPVSLLERLQVFSGDPKVARSLAIVDGVELARQAADQALDIFPHRAVEIKQGVWHIASGLAEMYVMFISGWVRH